MKTMKTTKTINATKNSLRSGISQAVLNNDLEATRELIGQGAPVDRCVWSSVKINNIPMDYPSLLSMAIQHQNKEMVALLLAAGANLDSGYSTQNNYEFRPDIEQLVMKNMGELVNPANWKAYLLLDDSLRTKTINATKNSLRRGISRAVLNNDLKATQYLIGQGAPVDRCVWSSVKINNIPMDYPSLLSMAIQHQNKEMVALLLAAGANLDSGYSTHGWFRPDIEQLVKKKMGQLVNSANWNASLLYDSRKQLELRTVNQHLNTLAKLIQTIPINKDLKVSLQQKITNRNIDSLTIVDMNRLIIKANETANQYKDKRQNSTINSFVIGLLATYIVGIIVIVANAPLVWALLPAITAAIIGCGIAAYCNAQEKEQLSAADSARKIGLFLKERSSATSPSGDPTPQAGEERTEKEFTSDSGYC